VFDPLTGAPDLPVLEGYELSAASYASAASSYHIVQFDGRATHQRIHRLRSATEQILGYVPNHAFIVKATKAQRRILAGSPGVRWVGDYHPVYKIDPPILSGQTEADQPGNRVRLSIMGFRYEQMENLRDRLSKADASVEIESLWDQSNHRGWAIISLNRSEMARAAAKLSLNHEIRYIHIQPELKVMNDDSTWLHQSGDDSTFARTCFDNGLTGYGEVYGSADSGIDVDACQFRYSNNSADMTTYNDTQPPDVDITHPNNKIITYYVLENALPYGDLEAHGSATAGTAAGDNFENLATETDPGRDQHDGMAPGAKIVFLDIARDTGMGVLQPPMFDMYTQAWLSGARVHNNSWGPENQISYVGQGTVDTDEALWGDYWNLSVFFGAGNTGPQTKTLGGHVSKNAVQVAANMHYGEDDPNDMTGFSSHGPTSDYRYKPDLAATGGKVFTAYADGQSDPPTDTCDTYRTAGTSFAAPTAAGHGLLAREYFVDGYYPTGAPVPADAFDPSSALVKAVLLNSTTAMSGRYSGNHGTKESPRPNFGQGWGRITIDDTLYFPGDTRDLAVLADIRNGAASPDPGRPAIYPAITTGDTHEYDVTVSHAAAMEPLRITLNWADPEGPTGWGPCLVNDLDLVVTDPLGRVYKGNIYFKNAFSYPDSGAPADNLNNNENIFIEYPVAGDYHIEVNGTNVPGNGAMEPYDSSLQGYALIAAGGFSSSAGARAEFQTFQIIGGRDGDDFIDIEETVTIGIQVINTGLAQASGVSCTLTVDPSSDIPASAVDIPNPTRSYGLLDPGQAKPNAFPVTLLGTETEYCNRTITFNAEVSASGGPTVNTTFIVEVAKNLVEKPLFDFESGLEGWTLQLGGEGADTSPDPPPGLVDCDDTGDRPTPRYALKFGPRDCTSEYSNDVTYRARYRDIALPPEDEIYSLKFWHRYKTQEGRDWCDIWLWLEGRYLLKEYQGPVDTTPDEMFQEEIDLSFHQQHRPEDGTIGLEFELTTNPGGPRPLGWILDDISIVVKTCDLSDSSSPAPTVAAADPDIVPAGISYTRVAVTGSDFVDGAVVSTADPGITVHGTLVHSDTSLTVILSTDEMASGAKSLTVTNPDTQSGTGDGILTIGLPGGMILTGPGPGPDSQTPPQARVWEADADLLLDFLAYTDFDTHGLNVTGGDIDGDGQDEIITGPGEGSNNPTEVRIFETDGEHKEVSTFLAYGVQRYGVNVTAGDLTGNGIDEIVTGAGPGKVFGPHVRGWSVNSSGSLSIPVSYFAYGTKKFGVNVATANVDNDDFAEILTGAGPGYVFGPHVRGWNYDDQQITTINGLSFFAYNTRHWGVNVSSGNMDDEPKDEIITGPGPGTIFGPHIRAFDFEGGSVTPVSGVNFFAYDTRKFGANVAGGDLDGDGYAEIVVGPGPGPTLGPWVRVFNYDNSSTSQILNFKAYDDGKYGVNVGTASAYGY
jgi:hypothetical protein